MIIDLISMNGYGIYVWSAFLFTMFSFITLYLVVRVQYAREKNKFLSKYETLSNEKAKIARSQPINQEILSSSQSI